MEDKHNIVKFEGTELQINIIDNQLEMSIEELTKALGYGDVSNIKMIIQRNPELKTLEFSYLKEVINIENGIAKRREKRFFNEQGIYEVAFLANTERAKNFRRFARTLITKLRKNELVLNNSISLGTEKKMDEMIALIVARDEELKDLVTFLLEAKDKFNKIETIEKDVKEIKQKTDEIVEAVNDLIDEVYEEE